VLRHLLGKSRIQSCVSTAAEGPRPHVPQFVAMVLLWEEDGQTVEELGQKLFLQSNTLTSMLKRLETLGYIERRRDSADERQVRINLTEAGGMLRLRTSDIVQCPQGHGPGGQAIQEAQRGSRRLDDSTRKPECAVRSAAQIQVWRDSNGFADHSRGAGPCGG
jgi:DNA-binding MarR family transcriptional regulator